MPSRQTTRRQKIKKNSRLVASTGWAWLIISLMTALFFGGAVRSLLSERQVRQWIERTWEKEKPAYQLKFVSAKVELADGVRPRFGLRVRGLELNPVDPCTHEFKLQIDNLFLPGPLSVLWGARLHFGQISAAQVKVDRLPSCKSAVAVTENPVDPVAKSPVTKSSPTASPANLAAEKFLRERWPLELMRTAHWLDGVSFEEVEVTGMKAPFQMLHLSTLQLELREDGSAAQIKGELGFSGQMNEALAGNRVQFETVAKAESVDVRVHIPVREGRLTVNANASFKTMDYSGDFNLDFIPAASLIEVLKQTNVITDPINLKRAWLTGQGRWTGKLLTAPLIEMIHADSVKLSGDAGSVQVQGIDLKPINHTLEFKPFNVRLEDFSLRYLLEALGRKGYTGVLSDFGHLTGDLQVTSDDDLAFRGELEDLSLNFSRQSVRVPQKINLIRGALELKGKRVSGLVKDIQLDGGVLRGQASFNLDRQVLNGVFQVKVDELQFRPEVQQLMVGGSIAPIALYGQGQMSEGQVKQWSGEVGSKEINGLNWKVGTLKIRSEFANGLMMLQVRADTFSLLAENSLRQQFAPVLAKFEKLGPDLNLKHVSARLEVGGNGVTRWRNSSASSSGGDILFATTGKFESGQVDGFISVDSPAAKMVKWGVLGPWNQLQISPLH